MVVGPRVLGIAEGNSVANVSGEATANLDYSNIKHVGPVFHRGTINERSRIDGLRESKSKPDHRGQV